MPNKEKEVHIGGLTYPLWYHADALKATGARGQYLGDEQKILMDTKLPRGTFLRTVLHEALHGVFEKSPLTAGGTAQREVSEETEEKIVTMLEREIPDLFFSNPWLKEVFE